MQKKDLMNTRDLLNEARKIFYSQHKELKNLEAQVEEKKAEMGKLSGFLKSLDIDPDEVIKKKQMQAERIQKARLKKQVKK